MAKKLTSQEPAQEKAALAEAMKLIEVPKAPNFKDFQAVKSDYMKGLMPEKIVVALRNKLANLYESKAIIKEETDLLRLIFSIQRKKGKITHYEEKIINEIEMAECDEMAIVKTDHAPQVLHLKKGLECKFKRNQIDGRVVVYVPQLIPQLHQLSHDNAFKLATGHQLNLEDLPPIKTIIHRVDLKDFEFSNWFDPVVDEITGYTSEKKETYQF